MDKEKETKQKDLEGKDAPDMKGTRGILLPFVVTDIISHDKGEKKSICLFTEIRKDTERMFTVNLVINNIKKDGMEHLAKIMGAKIVLKTPLMGELFIPDGEILDHWEETKPAEKED